VSAFRIVAATERERTPLLALFNDVYTGYEVPVHLDEAGFATMINLCDLDVGRSVIGLEGDTPVALGMLGLRGPRAWIGGMGVKLEARGRGYGVEIMRALIGNARTAGARDVDLEVLVGNTPAIRVYEGLGFRTTRRLVVWLVDPAAAPAPSPEESGISPLDVGAALDMIDDWLTEPPPWQRARATLAHLPEPPAALGLMQGGAPAAAIVFRAVAERASVLALGARIRGPQAAYDRLLGAVRARHPGATFRMLNMAEDDPAMGAFERLNARAEARQLEMRLAL
jgi:GNAT superfamily N-acetyltransferase